MGAPFQLTHLLFLLFQLGVQETDGLFVTLYLVLFSPQMGPQALNQHLPRYAPNLEGPYLHQGLETDKQEKLYLNNLHTQTNERQRKKPQLTFITSKRHKSPSASTSCFEHSSISTSWTSERAVSTTNSLLFTGRGIEGWTRGPWEVIKPLPTPWQGGSSTFWTIFAWSRQSEEPWTSLLNCPAFISCFLFWLTIARGIDDLPNLVWRATTFLI